MYNSESSIGVKYKYHASADADGDFTPAPVFVLDSVFESNDPVEIVPAKPKKAAAATSAIFTWNGIKYSTMAEYCRACGYARLKKIWHQSAEGSKWAHPLLPWLKDVTLEEVNEFLRWKAARAAKINAGLL